MRRRGRGAAGCRAHQMRLDHLRGRRWRDRHRRHASSRRTAVASDVEMARSIARRPVRMRTAVRGRATGRPAATSGALRSERPAKSPGAENASRWASMKGSSRRHQNRAVGSGVRVRSVSEAVRAVHITAYSRRARPSRRHRNVSAPRQQTSFYPKQAGHQCVHTSPAV